MASFNLTNFDAAMKHMYPIKKVENLVYKNNPLLSMMPKVTSFAGRNVTYAVEYGQTPGRSANFLTAQTNRGGTKLEDFVVTRVKDYAVVSLDNETLLAADGSEGSLLDVAKAKTDSALHALARSMGQAIYRDGTGYIGSTDVTGADPIIVLENAADIRNFEIGMRVVRGTSTPGDNLRDNGAAGEIISVDRSNGRFTIHGNSNAVWPNGQVNDKLYLEGDATDNATPGTGNFKRLAGLESWCPQTAPGATEFFGVNRSQDTTRLGGQRITGSGFIKESLLDAMVTIHREGGMPSHCFLPPDLWLNLANDMVGAPLSSGTSTAGDSRRRYGANDASGVVGWSAIELAGPSGVIPVYADHNCQPGVAWVLQMDTWEFRTLGSAPRILDFDGLSGLREQNADGVEYRWGWYGNILCKAPGYNAVVTGLAAL